MADNSNDDITTKAGLIARTRKATVAAVAAGATWFGPALINAGSDGSITGAELLPILTIGVTLTVGTWVVTWGVRNAS